MGSYPRHSRFDFLQLLQVGCVSSHCKKRKVSVQVSQQAHRERDSKGLADKNDGDVEGKKKEKKRIASHWR